MPQALNPNKILIFECGKEDKNAGQTRMWVEAYFCLDFFFLFHQVIAVFPAMGWSAFS
jgi:hypothetical protein